MTLISLTHNFGELWVEVQADPSFHSGSVGPGDRKDVSTRMNVRIAIYACLVSCVSVHQRFSGYQHRNLSCDELWLSVLVLDQRGIVFQ